MENGQAVNHRTFGDGVIKEVRGDRADVLFTSGLKAIILAYLTVIEPNKTTKALGCAGTPARTVDTTVEEFVKYLQSGKYLLQVYIFTSDQVKRVLDEYRVWSGEELPILSMTDYVGRYDGFTREWRLECPYTEDMPCSVPIIEGGSIGKGHRSESPHGIRYGNTVGFYCSDTIEEFVRAGLRA